MTPHYEISRVAARAAEPELLRIWRANLPVTGDATAKLRWTYRDVPDHLDRAYLLAVRDGDGASEIVGSAGIALRRFASPDRDLRVGLGCDLAVDREHRTGLPALLLVRAIRRDACAELDLVYNFPNHRAHALYVRAGYHDLGAMVRYVKVLRTAPYLARRTRIAAAAARVLDLALHARIALRSRGARHLRMEWCDDVDPRFDALWYAVQARYTLVGRRDATWLRWRCLANPAGRSRVAALVDDAGTLRAYAAVHEHEGIAHVADLFGHPADLDPLLALLCAALRSAGAASVSFRYLGSPYIVALLRAHGFRARDAERHVFVAPGDALAGPARARVLDSATWHLTDYDEDN